MKRGEMGKWLVCRLNEEKKCYLREKWGRFTSALEKKKTHLTKKHYGLTLSPSSGDLSDTVRDALASGSRSAYRIPWVIAKH